MFGTDVCFLSDYWLKKVISCKFETKVRKCEKMLGLISQLKAHSDSTLNAVFDELSLSDKAQATMISTFNMVGLSPICTMSKEIPYLQSISSLLESDVPRKIIICRV
jgi:hypothetical protein